MLSKNSIKIAVLSVAILVFYFDVSSYAAEDGFAIGRKIESHHFTMYYAQGVDPAIISNQFSISLSDRILAGESLDKNNSAQESIAEAVDVLFVRVCDILDMNLYSFHGNIKVCQNEKEFRSIYKILFGKDIVKEISFYDFNSNTIYLPQESFKREILGHEIAHAVICHYFVVLPSVKIQEVLAMFVEFQLRKSGS